MRTRRKHSTVFTPPRGTPARSARRSHGRIGPPTRHPRRFGAEQGMCVPRLAAEANRVDSDHRTVSLTHGKQERALGYLDFGTGTARPTTRRRLPRAQAATHV